jgi:protein-S-isoprenylcysteine O-methyltransferase Ste14
MAEKPDSPGVVLMPPAVFFVCLLGGIAVALVYGGTIQLLPQTPRLVSGAVLALAGFAFMGWGHRRFRSLGVAVKTNLPASQLVGKGAYRISRNPMYVGFVAILLGLGLASGSIAMLVSAVPMFLYLDWFVIPREEKYLRRTFGEDYREYCRRVRRWL